MKNKPQRHKSSNTFKFQTFSERIANIDIDVFHRVRHLNENDEEDDYTFFYKTIMKYNDLNLSIGYAKLKGEIGHDIQTLPQLLTQKERLVGILAKYLEEGDSLSLQPSLELVVALAQDLRQEFYPFYSELLSKVLVLLNTKNTDQLEWTFTCLAYLFKYLWRFLLKDMTVVFGQLLPLLSSTKPQYVNNFAAESFAFVARKVKDKHKFLRLVLEAVNKNNDSIVGCGRLFFELINGVQGQFHSCAESWIPFLLESLTDQGFPHRLLLDVLKETVTFIASSVYAKNSKLFWDELLKLLLKQSLLYKEKAGAESLQNVSHLLELTLKTLEQKNCCFMGTPLTFSKALVEFIKANNWPSHIMILIADISSTILLSPRITLPQDRSAELVQKTLTMGDWDSTKHFTIRLLSYSGFETLVLPYFIQLSEKQVFDDVLLQLTKIILFKRPLTKCFNELQNRAIYPLATSQHREERMLENLLNKLNVKSQDDIESKMEEIICVLIVLPHMSLNSSANCAKIKDNLLLIINILINECIHKNESKSSTLFLFYHLLNVMYSIWGEVNIDIEGLLQYLLPLLSTDILALQVLELYVNIVKQINSEEIRKQLIMELVQNLASPFHKMRLLSAYALQSMEKSSEDDDFNKIISTTIAAESITPSVQEYRDKLTRLQLLECKSSQEQINHFLTPLNFLMGNLYINFKLLWEPVSALIVSYAKTLPTMQFWPAFVKQLNLAATHAQTGITTNDSHNFKCEALVEASKSLASVEDRPDVSNYRILLWQLMVKIPEVCEEKNRDIASIFLQFLENEYYKMSSDEGTSWNIKQGDRSLNVTSSSNHLTSDDTMEVDSDNPDLNETQESNKDDSLTSSNPYSRSTSKSLLAHLAVFACLRNPRSIYREPELQKAYLDFLSHKNPAIQKVALDCIMTYKNKHVISYKEHLYGLIDDKTFKEEVTLFRIDTDNNIIRPEHRKEVIPIVMRIVYSKMLNRSGVRTGSKSAKQARRSIVFRFLAGCQENELLFYLKMAFRLYSSVVKDDVADMVSSIKVKLDISSMTPPKRLLSTANMLTVVLTQCGSLLSATALRFLLRVLLCVGATAGEALSQRQLVHPPYLSALRTIRNTSLDVLSKFFHSFESFPWTTDELDAVFDVLVWPYLSKLPVEGIHSPTSLLKLLAVWSHVPRYFPLLAKYHIDDDNLTPLPYVMSLLLSPKAHGSVINTIMDIVERLLIFEPPIEDEMADVPLPVTNVLQVQNYSIKGERTYGKRILFPHIPSILERIKVKLSKSKATMGKRDLTILSIITELVHDSETSETLLSLLLPIVGKKATAGEHVICPLISSITNLLKNVKEPNHYVRNLAILFGSVSGAEPRRMLSTLVKNIDRPEHGLNAKVLDDLNAWNARWLDQPDFERRLDAFKTIQELNTNSNISVELGVIIIHTCFHFIRTEKDMSLRDSSSQCLRTLCPNLCKQYPSEKDYLVNKTILELTAAGIRDKKSEPIQQEAIILLGYLARECSDIHPVLRDLSLLGNKLDLEVDFFENLQHLQLHRKVRALLKFCAVCKGLDKPMNTRTLTQFLLPIVSQFLCSEKYMNKNTIVDAAIQVLGTVCKMLPWHHYEIVLRFYLNKLRHSVEYQKQLIRIIVEILNSFHFDLRNADMINACKVTSVTQNQEKTPNVDNNNSEFDDNSNTEKEENEINANEDLDSVLENNEPVNEGDNELMEEGTDITTESILDRQAVLNKSLATRVIYTIKTILLPQLHKVITARTQSDAMHKVNRKLAGPDRDEEDVLRIPIALAIVKLLQRLPEEVLKSNICGIFMKLSSFLKSRLDSVRRITREILQKSIESLGPKYLHQLFQEMTSILKHGFHVHVLIYSIHSILAAIKPLLQSGDLDSCVLLIMQAVKLDLFGKSAEEKEVKAIAGNLMEARANRSYDMCHILAEFTTQKCLMNLVIPLKEELSQTFSHSNINKGRECLRHIVLGLVDNKFISTESLLIFAYGTASESIPSLLTSIKKEETNEKINRTHLEERVDSFLIPKEPKSRQSVQSKLSDRANAHIFVEFGLQLYYFLLKREKIKGADYRPHLDPLVNVLKDCLQSKYVKISSLSLQCLSWVVKFDLPSLHSNIEVITESIFDLLHKYAAAGLSKGDNFDLVMAAFKVVAVLVRDVKYHKLSKKQQHTLLLYCEQDIHDYSRQAVAFSLLKAILGRKLQLPELNGVMEKVAKISITADIEHVRLQARQVFHQYLMSYAIDKKFEKHLTWYLQQLEYDLQPGRESALEMIKALVNTLPEKVLKEQSGFIFVTIAARLINDEAPACRKMAADIIALLLDKVNKNTRTSLFDIVILWMKDKKVLHRRLAVQLCGIFATQDKETFLHHIPVILPLVDAQVISEIKEVKPHDQDNDKLLTKEQLRDHHLYQLMHLAVKISTLYPYILTEQSYTKTIKSIAESAQTLLAYPHEWVRLAATQLIGKIMSVLNPTEVASIANKESEEQECYLLCDSHNRLKTLTLDLCSQLTPGVELNEKLLMQTMKNLIFIAEVLQHLHERTGEYSLSLQWLIRKIRKIINTEIVHAPNSTTLRTICYNWLAALVLKIDVRILQPLLPFILAPIVRELNMAEEEGSPLNKIARETANIVKKKITSEEFNRIVNSLTTKLLVKRAERKKERAQFNVREPEKAAKRKINKQMKKKNQKKKKIDHIKGKKVKRKPIEIN